VSANKHVFCTDPRLKREFFRRVLVDMVSSLIHRGGVAYLYDEHGRINGRTCSQNPGWFQFIVCKKYGQVRWFKTWEAQRAVEHALKGKALGAAQLRFVAACLDTITGDRTESEEGRLNIKLLKEEILLRRISRSLAKQGCYMDSESLREEGYLDQHSEAIYPQPEDIWIDSIPL